MGSEDQDLTVHSKKIRRDYHHPKGKHFHQNKSRKNQLRCFTCDEIGHYSKKFPRNKRNSHKKKEKIKHHAHTTEDDDPPRKTVKQESENSSSDEEYFLISTLMGTITHGSNDWLIDSGASNHMTRFKESFVKLSEHELPHKVKLGDDYQYPIKGSGESSYKLESRNYMKMKDVFLVSGLKNNLLSISALDEKGIRLHL